MLNSILKIIKDTCLVLQEHTLVHWDKHQSMEPRTMMI